MILLVLYKTSSPIMKDTLMIWFPYNFTYLLFTANCEQMRKIKNETRTKILCYPNELVNFIVYCLI